MGVVKSHKEIAAVCLKLSSEFVGTQVEVEVDHETYEVLRSLYSW